MRVTSIILHKEFTNLSRVAYRDTISEIYWRFIIKSVKRDTEITTKFLVGKRVSSISVSNN